MRRIRLRQGGILDLDRCGKSKTTCTTVSSTSTIGVVAQRTAQTKSKDVVARPQPRPRAGAQREQEPLSSSRSAARAGTTSSASLYRLLADALRETSHESQDEKGSVPSAQKRRIRHLVDACASAEYIRDDLPSCILDHLLSKHYLEEVCHLLRVWRDEKRIFLWRDDREGVDAMEGQASEDVPSFASGLARVPCVDPSSRAAAAGMLANCASKIFLHTSQNFDGGRSREQMVQELLELCGCYVRQCAFFLSRCCGPEEASLLDLALTANAFRRIVPRSPSPRARGHPNLESELPDAFVDRVEAALLLTPPASLRDPPATFTGDEPMKEVAGSGQLQNRFSEIHPAVLAMLAHGCGRTRLWRWSGARPPAAGAQRSGGEEHVPLLRRRVIETLEASARALENSGEREVFGEWLPAELAAVCEAAQCQARDTSGFEAVFEAALRMLENKASLRSDVRADPRVLASLLRCFAKAGRAEGAVSVLFLDETAMNNFSPRELSTALHALLKTSQNKCSDNKREVLVQSLLTSFLAAEQGWTPRDWANVADGVSFSFGRPGGVSPSLRDAFMERSVRSQKLREIFSSDVRGEKIKRSSSDVGGSGGSPTDGPGRIAEDQVGERLTGFATMSEQGGGVVARGLMGLGTAVGVEDVVAGLVAIGRYENVVGGERTLRIRSGEQDGAKEAERLEFFQVLLYPPRGAAEEKTAPRTCLSARTPEKLPLTQLTDVLVAAGRLRKRSPGVSKLLKTILWDHLRNGLHTKPLDSTGSTGKIDNNKCADDWRTSAVTGVNLLTALSKVRQDVRVPRLAKAVVLHLCGSSEVDRLAKDLSPADRQKARLACRRLGVEWLDLE